jgi:heat shock protein HtpX
MKPLLSTVNLAQQRRHQRRNAVHSLLLVCLSGLLMGLVARSALGLAGLLWAGLLLAGSLWSVTRVSATVMLGLFRGRELDEGEWPQLFRTIRDLSARADLPAVPRIFYMPSRAMNAFAIGRSSDSAIAVTDGLLRKLTHRQLAGVLAHEMSHIRKGDLSVMALADILSRITALMSLVGLVGVAIMPALGLEGNAESMPLAGVLLLIVAPSVGGMLQRALSRAREYDADLEAVGLTGDPEGLTQALLVLDRRQQGVWDQLVVPGLRLHHLSVFRTHPRTERRILRLHSLRTPRPATIALRSAGERSFVPAIGRCP